MPREALRGSQYRATTLLHQGAKSEVADSTRVGADRRRAAVAKKTGFDRPAKTEWDFDIRRLCRN